MSLRNPLTPCEYTHTSHKTAKINNFASSLIKIYSESRDYLEFSSKTQCRSGRNYDGEGKQIKQDDHVQQFPQWPYHLSWDTHQGLWCAEYHLWLFPTKQKGSLPQGTRKGTSYIMKPHESVLFSQYFIFKCIYQINNIFSQWSPNILHQKINIIIYITEIEMELFSLPRKSAFLPF